MKSRGKDYFFVQYYIWQSYHPIIMMKKTWQVDFIDKVIIFHKTFH